jgi:hypothetical protein
MNTETDINIREFDPKTVPFNSVMLMLGMRNSGKSTCIKDLLYHHRNMPKCTVMSGTEDASPFFKKFMPLSFIKTNIEESVIIETIKRQSYIKKAKQVFEARGDKEKATKIDTRAALILDDCVGKNSSLFRTNAVKEMFMNGRHFDLMFLISLQYATSIHPDLRTNINYVFIFSEPRLTERKRIWNNFGTLIPDFDLFCKLMDLYTTNYGCLVIQIGKSINISDNIFRYRGNLNTSNFKLGDQVYWKKDEIDRSKIAARELEQAEKVFEALNLADMSKLDAMGGGGGNTKKKGAYSNVRINSV